MRIALASTFLAFAGATFADEPPVKALPLTANNANDLKQQYERTLKEFNDSIETVKDNPEAKEALEKARDEFKKGMEEKLKEAEKVIPQPREGRGGRFVFPDMPQQNVPAELQQLQQLQQELRRERMDALRALQGLNGAGRSGGRLGLRLEAVSPLVADQLGLEKNGVAIAEVVKDSAAEKAGLKANDILLQVQGKDIGTETARAVEVLSAAKEGEKLDLVVLRKGKKEKVEGLLVPAEPKAVNPFTGRAGGVRVINRGMSIQINNGEVTASGTFEGGVEVVIQGTMNGGVVEPSKITIKDGEATHVTDTLEKVPEKYRGQVDKLLGSVGGNRRDRER